METNIKNKPRQKTKLSKLILGSYVIKKVLPFTCVLIICLIIIIPLFSLIKSKSAAMAEKQKNQVITEQAKTNVVTLEMVPGLLEEKISLPGVAKPWVSLDVVAEVRGKIIDKKVYEGRHVQKGDILAMIDKSDYQNAYNSALASYETAVTTEKRLKALVKKNFVTQSQLDDATSMVKTTKAAVDTAKLNLERCAIISPMSGIVDRVYIENGTFLNSGDPVARIIQIDKLKITVGIPESDVSAVRKLSSFDMVIDALNNKLVTGKQHYLYKTSDSLARLYNLEIEVNNNDGQILPDMFARVNIIKQKESNGLAVPMYSMVDSGKQQGVFVEKDGRVHFTPIKTGFQDGWRIQVTDGLTPGDRVVVVGQRIIEDGEDVTVTRAIKHMEELVQ